MLASLLPSYEFYGFLKQIFTHLLMFTILLVVLKRFLWIPFLNLLDERAAKLREEFDKTEAARLKFEGLQKDLESRIKGFEDEARQRMNEEIAKARVLRDELLAKANDEARAVREKSEREIRQQIANARVELKDEIVRLTLYATGKLINEKLDDQKHRGLVGDFISNIDKR